LGRIDDSLRRINRDVGRDTGAESAPVAPPWDLGRDESGLTLLPDRAVPHLASTAPGEVVRPAEPVLTPEGRLTRFRGREGAVGERLVSATSWPVLVEQFRSLAASLHQAQQEQQLRSLVVTSAAPGDGKSLVAANLALTLSESYRRKVLLIDADLRRPSLHQLFNVPGTGGLSAGLKAKEHVQVSLVQITDMLTLLPGGRSEANPVAGLVSSRMKRIIAEAVTRFDWVIVDTPPVGVLADGRVVSDLVDAAILVVRAGVTRFADVHAAVETIGRERIVGVVLNAADPRDIQGEGYYRHYYGRDLGELEKDADERT
jgi:capsular exopolysaccharide synthesis family protein